MKQSWMNRGLLLVGMLGSFPSLAAEPYGNAQHSQFHKAITGGSELSLEEQAALNAMVPKRLDQRLYAGLRFNSSHFALENFRNRSTDANQAGIIAQKRSLSTQKGFSAVLGYQFSTAFRADLEYFGRKNLLYTANPVLTGAGIVSQKFDGVLKGNTVFVNAYYDFAYHDRFIPYLSCGLGLSKYTITSTLSPAPATGASESTSPIKPAYTLGVGLKARLLGDSFLDLSYRYMQLGSNLQFRANSGFMLDASQSASVLGLGLSYVF